VTGQSGPTAPGAESPAARQAAVARDVLEGVMLSLTKLPRRVDRAPLTQALEATLRRLTRLQGSTIDDPGHLDLLTAAQGDVKRAQGIAAESDAGMTAQAIARRIAGVGQALEQARAATIERLVAVQAAALQRAAPDQAPPVRPFQVSFGWAALHWLDHDALDTAVHVASSEPDTGDDEDELAEADQTAAEAADETGETLATLTDDAADEPAEDEALELEALERSERERFETFPVLGQPTAAVPLFEATLEPGLAGELAQARRLARDCMEELGALGNLRQVRRQDRWAGVAGFDQRLLNDLDAFVALGHRFCRSDRFGVVEGHPHATLDVLQELLSYARDSLTVDTARSFARAFLLGCVEGDDVTRAAVLALRQSHPYTYAAQGRALALASSPAIVPAMRRLCFDGDAKQIAVALDVLLARSALDLATVVTLLEHLEPQVRRRAARCMGFVVERQPASELLGSMIETEDEDAVMAAMAEALLRQAPDKALTHIRGRLEEDLAEPGMLEDGARLELVRLLGIGGAERDAALLHRLLGRHPSEASALGWHGHPGHVERLIQTLEGSTSGAEWRLRQQTAAALWRLTGADLRPAVDVGPDEYEQPTDPTVWRAWWTEHHTRFAEVQRYRFGRPYAPAATIDELRREGAPMAVRHDAALELAVLAERPLRLRVDDWVARQLSQLDVASAALDRLRGHPADRVALAAGRWLPDWPRVDWDPTSAEDETAGDEAP